MSASYLPEVCLQPQAEQGSRAPNAASLNGHFFNASSAKLVELTPAVQPRI